MSDNKASILELITQTAYELAQEIGVMEQDDPRRGPFLEELGVLTKLRRFLRLEADQLIGPRMDELIREMATKKPGDARRAQIVQEIMLSWMEDPGEVAWLSLWLLNTRTAQENSWPSHISQGRVVRHLRLVSPMLPHSSGARSKLRGPVALEKNSGVSGVRNRPR